MAFVLALLLLGTVQAKLPTDADIARQIESTIRAQLHPANVQVVVSRHSPLTTTVQHLEITITGFTLDGLPALPGLQPAADTQSTPHNAMQQYIVRPSGRQIRIMDAQVVCRDFVLKSLPVQELTLHIHELRIPLNCVTGGSFAISGVESVIGSVVLQQQGLTDFLRGRKLPLARPEVVVTPDGCSVKGLYHAALLTVPVEVSGRLIVKEQAILCLGDPKLKMSRVTLPRIIADRLLKGVNPLVDLNTDFALPAPVTITQITHAAGSLRLDAMMNFPPPE